MPKMKGFLGVVMVEKRKKRGATGGREKPFQGAEMKLLPAREYWQPATGVGFFKCCYNLNRFRQVLEGFEKNSSGKKNPLIQRT